MGMIGSWNTNPFREEWLDELPSIWPVNVNSDISAEQIEQLRVSPKMQIMCQRLPQCRYRILLSSVRSLKAERHVLQQKLDHYQHLSSLIAEGINLDKLRSLFRGTQAGPAKKRSRIGTTRLAS